VATKVGLGEQERVYAPDTISRMADQPSDCEAVGGLGHDAKLGAVAQPRLLAHEVVQFSVGEPIAPG